jgi:spore germination protein YaaH
LFLQKFLKNFFHLIVLNIPITKLNTNNSITCGQSFYKAGSQDTLIKVAKKFNLKLDSIREMNPKIKFVRPGMSLKVCR